MRKDEPAYSKIADDLLRLDVICRDDVIVILKMLYKVGIFHGQQDFLETSKSISWPSKKEAYEAASEFVLADHCKAAFYKGTKWLREKIENETK